jgi:predicted HTH transcriptional regulator
MEADDLLARHEGKTLEFKRDASSPMPLLRTLSAFSNTAGGTLVIGIEDRSRRVMGVKDPLGLEERILNLATDGIRPQILPEVEVLPCRGKSLLAVTVFPGPLRPYFVRALGREKGSYVRLGSTNRPATPEILAELERAARNTTYDEQPLPRLGKDAVDFDLARARFEGRRKLRREDLAALGLVAREGRSEKPTVGGVLLFGRERLRHFPDARIRLAAFASPDRSSILDRMEATADPVQAIEDALHFVRRNTATGMVVEGAVRRDVPAVPPIALREAVVNAVVHADYSQTGSPIRVAVFADRVEIENPGPLPFGVTLAEVRRGVSKLRNRVVGRVFHELGLIENWGSGIDRMTRACEEMGLPAPELEELGTQFRVTLHATRRSAPHVMEGTPGRILALLADETPRSTSALAEALGVTTRTVRGHLRRLVDSGRVVEIGAGPNDPGRVYRVAQPE